MTSPNPIAAAAAAPLGGGSTSITGDVTALINKSSTYALNIDNKFPLANLFIPDDRLVMKSDADEQIIVHFDFGEAVSLQGIKFFAKGPQAPKRVKLYINRVSVSFDDIDSVPATMILELNENDFLETTKMTPIKQVLFARVVSLTIFVESNQNDEDFTSISRIAFFGRGLGGTNVAQLKKVGED